MTDTEPAAPAKRPLQEGVDYYLNEAGLLVLTERFLRARGYCCGNICRHCPYGPEAQAEARARRNVRRGLLG